MRRSAIHERRFPFTSDVFTRLLKSRSNLSSVTYVNTSLGTILIHIPPNRPLPADRFVKIKNGYVLNGICDVRQFIAIIFHCNTVTSCQKTWILYMYVDHFQHRQRASVRSPLFLSVIFWQTYFKISKSSI